MLFFSCSAQRCVESGFGNGLCRCRIFVDVNAEATDQEAGSRHAFETYLFVSHVDGLDKGIYHYLPMEHALEVWDGRQDFEEELTRALCGQRCIENRSRMYLSSSG